MIDISVVICTHNPRPHYFSRVIAALRDQTLPKEQWELLIIDNASKEPLTSDTWDLSWHPQARIIHEQEIGLAIARVRGIQEAAAALLVFVDDDNVLDSSYLVEAVRIGVEWPQLGVWGGSITPEFEVEPPKDLDGFLGLLALREIKAPRWSNLSTCSEAEPWGAGLCVRAVVATEYCLQQNHSTMRLIDRVGNNKSLMSGSDTEICFTGCNLGLGMGLFPDLKVSHLIPKDRLNEDYLVKLLEGIHTSVCLVNYKWHRKVPSSPLSGLGLLRIGKNLLGKRRIHRRMYLAEIRATRNALRIIEASNLEQPIRKQATPEGWLARLGNTRLPGKKTN